MIGLSGTYFVGRTMKSVLYEVSAIDPVPVGLVALVLMVAAARWRAICRREGRRGWTRWWRCETSDLPRSVDGIQLWLISFHQVISSPARAPVSEYRCFRDRILSARVGRGIAGEPLAFWRPVVGMR